MAGTVMMNKQQQQQLKRAEAIGRHSLPAVHYAEPRPSIKNQAWYASHSILTCLAASSRALWKSCVSSYCLGISAIADREATNHGVQVISRLQVQQRPAGLPQAVNDPVPFLSRYTFLAS